MKLMRAGLACLDVFMHVGLWAWLASLDASADPAVHLGAPGFVGEEQTTNGRSLAVTVQEPAGIYHPAASNAANATCNVHYQATIR